jgi:hypothetical protein
VAADYTQVRDGSANGAAFPLLAIPETHPALERQPNLDPAPLG